MTTKEVASGLSKLFRDILNEFILHREALKISSVPLTASVMIRIEAHSGDVRRIIGTGGAHFNALKIICQTVAHKQGIDIELPWVTEPKASRGDRYEGFKGREDWGRDRIAELLARASKHVFRCEEAIGVDVTDHPEFVSVLTLHIAKSEPGALVELMRVHLKALFNAVGKANGRTVIIEISPDREHEPPQPTESSGRYVREVRR